MKILWLSSFFLTGLLSAHAQVVTVYTPSDASTQAGNSRIMPDHWEYQQVFDASLFATIPAGGGMIRNIAFRPSRSLRQTGGELRGIIIELSTTTRSIDSLSPVFSENRGSDNFVFWSGQAVDIIVAPDTEGRMAWSPSLSVLPGKGFSYDPSKGNLLMTIHNLYLPEANFVVSYDGVRGSGLTSSVRGDPGTERGTVVPEGLVVRFGFTDVVPEPSAAVLLALGSAALLGISTRITSRKDTDVVA